MSRFLGILSVLLVVLVAMGFAAANAGHRVTVELGLFTLYRVPVALVAFSGLFIGMLVMFGAGIHTDLKVRRILRERLAQESQEEKTWIDGNQRDLFAEAPEEETPREPSRRTEAWDPGPRPSLSEPREEDAFAEESGPLTPESGDALDPSPPEVPEFRTDTETEGKPSK